MDDVNVSDEEYPQELLDAHYIEDSRLHHPADNVIHGLEALLVEEGVFQEMSPGEFPACDRWGKISEYIKPRSQEELYQEMRQHDDPVVSSAAKYINPEWKPQTKYTFEIIQMATSPGYSEFHETE